jgi:hypothetical protein
MLTGYSKYTAERISEGYIRGGYQKLKESYPKRFEAMEKDLEDNFTKEGLDIYRERMIKGLTAIGHYHD